MKLERADEHIVVESALRERIEREMDNRDCKDRFARVICRACAVEVAERLVREYEGMSDAVDVYRERAEAAEKERDDIRLGWNAMLLERDEARKALAEARGKWGHVAGCRCHDTNNCHGSTGKYDRDGCHQMNHPYRDPRCAPETGGGE